MPNPAATTEFPPGHRFTFVSPYSVPPVDWTAADFAARDGTEAEVIGLLADAEYDRAEIGDMYRIRFVADGATMTAWPEEIDPSLIR